MNIVSNIRSNIEIPEDTCVVQSICFLTDSSFEEIWLLFEYLWDDGMTDDDAKIILNFYGYKVINYKKKYERKSITTVLKTFKKGSYLIWTNDHVLCWKDGIVFDTNNTDFNKRVRLVTRIS